MKCVVMWGRSKAPGLGLNPNALTFVPRFGCASAEGVSTWRPSATAVPAPGGAEPGPEDVLLADLPDEVRSGSGCFQLGHQLVPVTCVSVNGTEAEQASSFTDVC